MKCAPTQLRPHASGAPDRHHRSTRARARNGEWPPKPRRWPRKKTAPPRRPGTPGTDPDWHHSRALHTPNFGIDAPRTTPLATPTRREGLRNASQHCHGTGAARPQPRRPAAGWPHTRPHHIGHSPPKQPSERPDMGTEPPPRHANPTQPADTTTHVKPTQQAHTNTEQPTNLPQPTPHSAKPCQASP